MSSYSKKLSNIDTNLYTAEYILSKALDIGENILRCGGEPHRIEDTVNRICTAYGAVHTDVFALPSLVMAGVRMADGTTSSQVRTELLIICIVSTFLTTFHAPYVRVKCRLRKYLRRSK